ncbi:MAG: signal recognition particle-docking protein FtsY [Gammaproteobacteria bacterium]|nr:MAG: signal recognition particle-docking protein FtsY [Gammaproteobacteria bacterium]
MTDTGVFQRLRKGLSKTSDALTEGLASAVLGKKELDDDLITEIEDRLVMADVGIETTNKIIIDLVARVSRIQLTDVEVLYGALQESIAEILIPCNKPLIMGSIQPFAILVVGVNGAGKTTTIGKIAQRLVEYRQTVLLAAGDTFRAAAVEQLQEWGKRINTPVIAQKSGADSAAVVFDAYQSAKARNMKVLIADTAGRLHTQQNLMEELQKIKRALQKIEPEAPHETLLVLEGGTGQNAINQAIEFHQALGVTGLAITKLDGSAKGGIVLAIADKLQIPIRYIGVGEAVDDLRVFNAHQYAGALLGREPITAEIT